ncbi:MAG: SDR family oxidoreductase [Chitinophagaceae bacterium]|nr:SDR family oxidoreductase [Chitinophagaceae bacterium]
MYEQNYHTQSLGSSTFLVTGGAGFIGSHIVEYLLKKGAQKVRVLDNYSTGSRENLTGFKSSPAFEMFEGDICDLETCKSAMQGVDYVLHQAALGSVPRSINDPIKTNEVNVSGFLNILVSARDAGVKRMIYAASSSTYGDDATLPKREDKIGSPLSPYAVSKYINELYASVFSRTYGFHTCGLRYFNVFGPRQNPRGPYAAVIPLFIQAALDKEPASINGDGETGRDFTFVENTVQANIRALFAPIQKHEVVNVACGGMTTLNDLWRLISKQLGVNIAAKHAPQRVGDIKHSLASIEKATKLFGYEPSIGMEEGLMKTIKWAKENKHIFSTSPAH